MTTDQAVELVRESLLLMLALSLPVLLAGLIIGLVISVLQAVTQVQEQTLSFVPKMLGMALVTVLAAPWIATQLMEFARRMFAHSS